MAFWICTPTAGPFAGSHLSSIRPGQQTPCSQHGRRTRARLLIMPDTTREGWWCGIRQKRELPPGSFGHCGAADGVCLGIPLVRLRDTEPTSDLCLAKAPSESTLIGATHPACICFSAVHVWKESLGFAASPRQESCCWNTTTPCVDHGGWRVVVDCATLMSPYIVGVELCRPSRGSVLLCTMYVATA